MSPPCRELLELVSKHQDRARIPCPITIKPTCHPKESLLSVHVDGKRRIIYLTCPRCEHIVAKIRIRRRINKGMKLEE